MESALSAFFFFFSWPAASAVATRRRVPTPSSVPSGQAAILSARTRPPENETSGNRGDRCHFPRTRRALARRDHAPQRPPPQVARGRALGLIRSARAAGPASSSS
uniref:Putative secreted protein n=1 Tax=Ixodes ricinus TaxID=34613 RepID=A0A6B0UD59_IXORI